MPYTKYHAFISLMSSSKGFIGGNITFRSVNHFESFLHGAKYRSKLIFMHMDLMVPLPFDEKTVLPSLNCLCTYFFLHQNLFIHIHMRIFQDAFFWFYWSLSWCQHYIVLNNVLESESINLLTFFFKVVLTTSGFSISMWYLESAFLFPLKIYF